MPLASRARALVGAAVNCLIVGHRSGKLLAARCFYVLAVSTWATWYAGRPYDAPYRLVFVG